MSPFARCSKIINWYKLWRIKWRSAWLTAVDGCAVIARWLFLHCRREVVGGYCWCRCHRVDIAFRIFIYLFFSWDIGCLKLRLWFTAFARFSYITRRLLLPILSGECHKWLNRVHEVSRSSVEMIFIPSLLPPGRRNVGTWTTRRVAKASRIIRRLWLAGNLNCSPRSAPVQSIWKW